MRTLLYILTLSLASCVKAQGFLFIQTGTPPALVVPTTDDGRYNSFGTLFSPAPGKKMYVFRSGTSHVDGGRVEIMDYNIATATWSNRRIIFDYTAPWDARDPRGGVITEADGTKHIYVFFIRADRSAGTLAVPTIRGYIRSTDATGTTWGEFVDLGVPRYGTPWGGLVTGDVAGTYFMPFWESDLAAGGRFDVGYYKTTNYGTTWTQVYTHQGTDFHCTETWMVNCGGGKMLMLSRIEVLWGQTGGLAQMTSTDGGATWSTMVRSNLGSSATNIPTLRYDQTRNAIDVLYQDRSDGYLKVSVNNPVATVFASPTAWKTPVNYEYNNAPADNNHNGLGYADNDGEMVIWAKEQSSTATFLRWRSDNLMRLN